MIRSIRFAFCLLALSASTGWSQKLPTASRAGDLQIGGGYSLGNSDYSNERFDGFAFYADFDFKAHWGAEAEFHQINQPKGNGLGNQLYERTYEIGGRYVYPIGRFKPYGKFMIGRGVFNYPSANLAFNMYAPGGGIDYHLLPWLNLRADLEYQVWPDFYPQTLNPKVIVIGAAYHFH